MKTIKIDVYKAADVGGNIPPNLEISVNREIAEFKTLDDQDKACQADAHEIESGLYDSLPGSTYDRLFACMAAHKASHYRVSHHIWEPPFGEAEKEPAPAPEPEHPKAPFFPLTIADWEKLQVTQDKDGDYVVYVQPYTPDLGGSPRFYIWKNSDLVNDLIWSGSDLVHPLAKFPVGMVEYIIHALNNFDCSDDAP